MSRKTEKRERTEHYTATVEIKCDLCGAKAPYPEHSWPWRQDWGSGSDRTEPIVKLRTGNEWPDGGFGETVEVDICPDCFRDRLLPWLREQGAEPRTEEWSW